MSLSFDGKRGGSYDIVSGSEQAQVVAVAMLKSLGHDDIGTFVAKNNAVAALGGNTPKFNVSDVAEAGRAIGGNAAEHSSGIGF